jgi:ketosteroid isomerase-like protein
VSSDDDQPAADAAEVVRELGARYRSGDVASAAALYQPDVRIEQPASLPHGGSHIGADGMAEMATRFSEHWDRTIGEARVFGVGDTAVQVTTQTWTAKTSGRSATVDVVELFTVTDGRIAEIRVFQQDTHLLLSTLDDA